MFRTFTTAAVLALTISAGQAETYTGWGARFPQSANDVCGSLLQSKHETKQFYRSWYNSCMRSTGAAITRQAEARAAARVGSR